MHIKIRNFKKIIGHLFAVFFFHYHGVLQAQSIKTDSLKSNSSFYFLFGINLNNLNALPSGVTIKLQSSEGVDFYFMHPIFRVHKISVASGIGLNLFSYDINGLISYQGNRVRIDTLPKTGYSVTPLVLGFAELPLEFNYISSENISKKRFGIDLGGTVGMRFTEDYSINGKNQYGVLGSLSKWKYKLIGRISYFFPKDENVKIRFQSLFISATYGLSSVFNQEKYSQIIPYSFGVGFSAYLN
jgi:hypothetical protein